MARKQNRYNINKPPYDEPADEPWHGTDGGYSNHKCHGPKCQEAHRIDMLARRTVNKRKELPADHPAHGTENGYNYWRCKCVPCIQAHSAGNRRRRNRKANKQEGQTNSAIEAS